MKKEIELVKNKRCYSCKETLSLDNFYRSNIHYYQKECKVCCKYRKGRWHKTELGKLSSANTKLKRRFGITLEDYNTMYKAQCGQCLICSATESSSGHRLAVDHDHTSGQIRGLLCKACNVGIGNLKDDPKLVLSAFHYLRQFYGN